MFLGNLDNCVNYCNENSRTVFYKSPVLLYWSYFRRKKYATKVCSTDPLINESTFIQQWRHVIYGWKAYIIVDIMKTSQILTFSLFAKHGGEGRTNPSANHQN